MIQAWSGREVRALRESQRLSIREFARRIGVSERMGSRWEAGGAIRPRPINQEGLDTHSSRQRPNTRRGHASRRGWKPSRLRGQLLSPRRSEPSPHPPPSVDLHLQNDPRLP